MHGRTEFSLKSASREEAKEAIHLTEKVFKKLFQPPHSPGLKFFLIPQACSPWNLTSPPGFGIYLSAANAMKAGEILHVNSL
jgi:hypothetical protein